MFWILFQTILTGQNQRDGMIVRMKTEENDVIITVPQEVNLKDLLKGSEETITLMIEKPRSDR